MKLPLAKCVRLMTARNGVDAVDAKMGQKVHIPWPVDDWGQLARVDCNCEDCRRLEDAIDSLPFEQDITRGEDLDGRGYEVERVTPPKAFEEFYGHGRKGYFCDGDLEYVVGGLRDLNCDGGAVAWFASVYDSDEWPKAYEDSPGQWRRLQHEGYSQDRDTDCYCGSAGFGGDVPPGMYPDDTTGDLKVCPYCAGRGYRNVPAYRIAIYGDPASIGETLETILSPVYPGAQYETTSGDTILFDVATGYLYAVPWDRKCDDFGPEGYELTRSFIVATEHGAFAVLYFTDSEGEDR